MADYNDMVSDIYGSPTRPDPRVNNYLTNDDVPMNGDAEGCGPTDGGAPVHSTWNGRVEADFGPDGNPSLNPYAAEQYARYQSGMRPFGGS